MRGFRTKARHWLTGSAAHRGWRDEGFAEDQRQKTDNRKALAGVLAALEPGDVLLVTRLDRLARSTRDLLNVLDAISQAAAGFKSLADTWADTTTPHGRLMLTVLGGSLN